VVHIVGGKLIFRRGRGYVSGLLSLEMFLLAAVGSPRVGSPGSF